MKKYSSIPSRVEFPMALDLADKIYNKMYDYNNIERLVKDFPELVKTMSVRELVKAREEMKIKLRHPRYLTKFDDAVRNYDSNTYREYQNSLSDEKLREEIITEIIRGVPYDFEEEGK